MENDKLRIMTIDFTKNEALLGDLIDKIEKTNFEFSAQRDKELLYALRMVLAISNDGQLKILIKDLSKQFPEYGKDPF